MIALAANEYVTDRSEPAFAATGGWYPSIPYVIRNGDDISAPVDSLVSDPGPVRRRPRTASSAAADTGQQRAYDQMAFVHLLLLQRRPDATGRRLSSMRCSTQAAAAARVKVERDTTRPA